MVLHVYVTHVVYLQPYLIWYYVFQTKIEHLYCVHYTLLVAKQFPDQG